MLSSACQEKELPEIGVVLLMFVPRAIIATVPWAGGGDGPQRAHLFQPPRSPVRGGARGKTWAGKRVCVAAACSRNKTPLHLSWEQESVRASQLWPSQEGSVLCCPCRVQRWHLTPHHRLLLPASNSALTPLAWDSSPFQVYCRCPAPDPAFCKRTSALHRQVSLCFPGSPFSAQLPNRLIRHSDLFLNFCCCCCYVNVLTWQL